MMRLCDLDFLSTSVITSYTTCNQVSDDSPRNCVFFLHAAMNLASETTELLSWKNDCHWITLFTIIDWEQISSNHSFCILSFVQFGYILYIYNVQLISVSSMIEFMMYLSWCSLLTSCFHFFTRWFLCFIIVQQKDRKREDYRSEILHPRNRSFPTYLGTASSFELSSKWSLLMTVRPALFWYLLVVITSNS